MKAIEQYSTTGLFEGRVPQFGRNFSCYPLVSLGDLSTDLLHSERFA